MRLINSNVFKEKLNYLNYELYNSHPVGELSKEEKDTVSWFIYHISKMIDNMPTEGAIPIEWIKTWAEKWGYPRYWAYRDIAHSIIEDWEKENETN